MKIQELLNKHKDKLWDGRYNNIELDDHIDVYFIDCDSDGFKVSFSLSDLLFSTPFLSLLEWKSDGLESRKHFCVGFVSYGCGSYNYHKINLVLLSNDEERKIYLETHTLG